MSTDIVIDLWNVGQGDATSVTLPSGELILIDVGPKNSSLCQWLLQKRPVNIKTVILTHNDADHAGALTSIVKSLHNNIDRVLILQDRTIKDFINSSLFRTTYDYHNQKKINLTRLEANNDPEILWQDDDGYNKLVIRYPHFLENVLDQTPNDSSAILTLENPDTVYIIWSGDAPLKRLSTICKGLNPELLFGPHHGAPIDKAKNDRSFLKSCIKQIKPKRCFISVGTSNPYSHPNPQYLKRLDECKCHISCSQLTAKCDLDLIVHNKSIMNTSGYYALPCPSKGCFCRGHMRIKISEGNFIDDIYTAKHRILIKEKVHKPKCIAVSKYMDRI